MIFINYTRSLDKSKIGRPLTDFSCSSDSNKRQKTADLRKQNSVEVICYAAQMELRKSGNVQASKILQEIFNNPARASEYISALNKVMTANTQLPPEEALSVLVEANLSRNQYNIIREKDKARFPSYKVVQQAKLACYPNGIKVSSSCAEVELQSLLQHTTKKILLLQEEILARFERKILKKVFLICKWGFDGSSGQKKL